MKLDAEYVRAILDYSPDTGVFKWKWRDDARKSHNSRYSGKVAGSVNTQGYLQIRINNRHYQSHRLAWLIIHGEWPPNDIDHIDGYKLNNRIANLRLATRQENKRNVGLRKDSTTGVTGVSWHRASGKFASHISDDAYKRIHLGLFDTIEEATAARAAAEIHYFGKFRRSPCNQNSGVL
jgi:hypothetical protein